MNILIPLAERLRPKTLDDYLGQEHLAGKDGLLRKFLKSGALPSFILWGPPGVGKTTLAQIIANQTGRELFILSAVNSGVKDVREVIETAGKRKFFDTPSPILFIDEIHRFSKSQQDSLLGAVEKGIVTLIGATTENPSFEVIRPLLSRMQVYTLKPLEISHLNTLLDRAINEDVYLKELNIKIEQSDALFRYSGGDARKLLGIIEVVVGAANNGEPIIINNEIVLSALKENMTAYDKGGEEHYDTISAFIKSVRGSDPNAAIYYLARMISGGEDPKFIARRLVILACEDIGLANPNALLIANSCFDAISNIGMPEGRIPLAEATIYLATSPKSNSAYLAIDEALDFIKKDGYRAIPLSIRNAPTALMKELNYGDGYKYSHNYINNFAYQEFMPEGLENHAFWVPGDNKKESDMEQKMDILWNKKYKIK